VDFFSRGSTENGPGFCRESGLDVEMARSAAPAGVRRGGDWKVKLEALVAMGKPTEDRKDGSLQKRVALSKIWTGWECRDRSGKVAGCFRGAWFGGRVRSLEVLFFVKEY
jgi:hypothetical protein